MSPRIGDSFIENGVKHYVAEVMLDGAIVNVRDPFVPENVCTHITSHLRLEPENENTGIQNIRDNAGIIKKSKGITSLPELEETVFLVGSGGSIANCYNELFSLHEHGTVIATNRACYLFNGKEECIDYAFFCDARSTIFMADSKWNYFDTSKVNGIFSLNVSTPLIKQNWKERYFYNLGLPKIDAWETEAKSQGINTDEIGSLDSGFCGLYSMIYMIAKHKNVKRVVLLGHDFSFVDYMFHFDERFSIHKHMRNHSDFTPAVVSDCNGNGILSLKYLTRSAQVVAFALKHLDDHEIKIYNGTCEGILYSPWIRNESLDIILGNNTLHEGE